MGQLKFIRAVVFAVVSAPLILAVSILNRASPAFARTDAAPTSTHSLFAQSAARILARNFPSENISYLLLDAQTGVRLASRWPDAADPIPLGSLVKPFAAFAYAERHHYRYPIFVCRGAASGCWQPRPHGRLDVSSALGYSCNSYFRDLTARLDGVQMRDVALQFGIDPPDPRLTGPPLMGIGAQWEISPLHMAHAYLELLRRRNAPGVPEIIEGLADSAKWGTGSEVGKILKREDVLVKTGTAVCRHTPRAPGDGFAVVIVPADQPVLLLMVRVHGVPGSRAAFTAAQMLSELQ
jgi:Penicillin binding protein transpeptidase domain